MYSVTIVIIEKVICIDGRTTGSLYYCEGNFYFPISLHGGEVSRVKKAARNFVKENKELVKRDRSDKNHKTVLEIFDEFYGDLKK